MARTIDGWIVVEKEPVWVLGKPEYGLPEEPFQFFVGKGEHLVTEDGELTCYKMCDAYHSRLAVLEFALEEAKMYVEYIEKQINIEKLNYE